MSDVYCDVFLRPDGTVGWHRYELPRMHVRAFNQDTFLWRDNQTDVVFVSSSAGVQALGGKSRGNYPAAMDESGVVWVQHDMSEKLTGYNWDGTPTGATLTAPYAAEGIAEVRGGAAVMMNDPSRIRTMPNGETWLNCVETAHYIVGQFGHDASGFGGSISYWNKVTGVVLRWLGYTPLPVFAREDVNGTLFVALSGNNAPAPDQVEWASHFPGEVPVEPPPTEPPTQATVSSVVVTKPMLYEKNGDLKLVLRVPKGSLATPKVGDTIRIVKD